MPIPHSWHAIIFAGETESQSLSYLSIHFVRREPFVHRPLKKRNHLPNLRVSGWPYLAAVQAAKTDLAVDELEPG